MIIAMAADYVTNVNYGFEQLATAVGVYFMQQKIFYDHG